MNKNGRPNGYTSSNYVLILKNTIRKNTIEYNRIFKLLKDNNYMLSFGYATGFALKQRLNMISCENKIHQRLILKIRQSISDNYKD